MIGDIQKNVKASFSFFDSGGWQLIDTKCHINVNDCGKAGIGLLPISVPVVISLTRDMQFAVKFVITCCLYQAVLCREFFISLPESIEALRGLCVLIPCSFDFKEQYDEQLQNNARGVWYKGDSLAKHKVFSSKSTEGNQINGKIIGDLYMKNCTTIFYNITTPISPSITLYKEDHGELMDQKQVLEGTLVRLMCSARSPCPFNPPTFTWNFLPEEGRQERYHNARFRSSQLNFKATHLHHGRDFTCTVTYQLQNFNKSEQSSFTLHVLYGPRNTSVSASPSASVLLGSSVSLSCSSDGNPAVLNYTWYRENGEQIGTGNHLTINTTDSPHSALYYCRAQNQHGDHNSSIHLDVLYAPQVSPTSSCNSAQDLIMCSCEVKGNPFPKLVWHFSGETLLPSESTSIREEPVGDAGLKSFITFHELFIDTPTLQCIGINTIGVDTHLFNPIKSECIHTAVDYLLLFLTVAFLLCVAVISFLIYKLKQYYGKIKVLKSGNIYASLQLSAPNTYEILQTHREGRLQENKV
ncbi:myelin-associated glycoprotein-like isoform X2 [Silurus meridionalis]|uniref:myelin-associated glycoprotein-like isoform X2 n=1 Tax=Silurus meridionalis TaxID=175797 RepID=UPI001EEBC44D|nr:myelin-associated glycoprotein-like isoform X2 [Silurus meridionalis]